MARYRSSRRGFRSSYGRSSRRRRGQRRRSTYFVSRGGIRM